MSLFDDSEANHPFDWIDDLMTKAMRRLPWVAVGMAITAALVYGAKHFTH